MLNRSLYQHGGMHERTAFVNVELSSELLEAAEKEARMLGLPTSALLRNILTEVLVSRYPK